MNNDTTQVVDAIGQMGFTGNIIPHTWYKTVVTAKGKADLNAIVILSEIVYWHRPQTIKDEATGALLGFKKKFKADKWQRSYASLGDQFGLSKGQVKAAIYRLVELSVVTREFRNFMSQGGIFLSNVMYLELVPEGLSLVTYPGVVQKIRGGGTTKPDTYTKTTTEIPTKTNADHQKDDDPPPMAEVPAQPEPAAVLLAKKKKEKKPAVANQIKSELVRYVVAETGLPRPSYATVKDRKRCGSLWWNPVLEMASWVENDIPRAQALIAATVAKMRRDKLTISSANSLVNVARALFAEGKGRVQKKGAGGVVFLPST